ncbi:MAG: TonB-dependent receptor [Maricaulaceae bacterium]
MTKQSLLMGAVFASTTLLASPAFAQDKDEVIVTATKRATTLQDTPISVSVTTADVIEQAQILDILSLQSVVPTFRVSQLQNSANTTLTIRGFGNGGNNLGIEPAVGLFIDGVYRSRAGAQIADLPALERVEVLAGPQTILFGKNASVGVVSIVTEKPQYDTQGYIEGGYGNFDATFGRAYITGGLSDNVAVSLGGGFQNRDGVFDSAEGIADGGLNDRGRYNLRGQLLWEPTDDLSVRLIADRSEIDENCCGTTTAIVGPTSALVQGLGGQLASVSLGQTLGENPDPFSQETVLNRETNNSIKDEGLSAQIDYDYKDLTFTSITSYRTNDSSFDSDSDFTSLEILENIFQDAVIDTFTQEFRVTSNYDGRLNWQLGATYFDETIDLESGIDFGVDARPFLDALGVAAAGDPTLNPFDPANSPLAGVESALQLAPGTFFGDDVVINETFRQDNESFSIFGTIDFDVTDRFKVTVGGNYIDDEKDVSVSTVNNDVFSNLTLTGADGVTVLTTGGIADNFPAVAASCGLGALPFSAANAGAVIGSPACFIDTLGNTAPGSAVFAGLQAQVAAGVAALDLTDPAQNPLLGLTAFQFQPQFLNFPNEVEDGQTRDDKFTYTVRGSYEVNDNFNVYGSYATGFKASSFNLTRDSRPFAADISALGAAGLLPNNFSGADATNIAFPNGRNTGTRFALPEDIEVFEIGVKSRFERGALNVAVFDQTVENFQSTIFQGTGFVLSNAGEQSTQGIEFDGTFDVADWLTLTAAGIIQDPVFDDFTGAPVVTGGALDLADGVADGVGDLSGAQPAGINEISLSTSATFKYDFGNGMNAYLRADYQYEDDVQVVDNIEGVNRSTNILNGAVGLNLDNGVGIRLWARNLTDDRSFTSAFPGVIQAGTVNAYPNEPRTYGVSLRYNFGGE